MSSTKKYFLDGNDDLKIVLKTIASAKDSEVILVLPHNSAFGRNLDNFETLKKELKKSKKTVIFESANENILQLAEIAGFQVSNPLFRREERIFSDILPNSNKKKEEVVIHKKIAAVAAEDEEKEADIENESEENEAEEELPTAEKPPRPVRQRQPINARRLFIRVLIGSGFAGAILLTLIVLPKATINLSLKKFEAIFDKPVTASAAIKKSEIKDNKILLAGELLVAKKNIQMAFPASGKENVSTKAKGKLTIYNAFSSQSQQLVATTRFQSPDGKIFRLDNAVTVPAAKVISGKIEPSSIEAAVTADQVGPEYNLATSAGKWRIPGFQGTPKYDGFYGEAKTALTGGFSGEKNVPTADDLKNARIKIEEALKSNLLNQVAVLMTGDLKLLPEAQSFTVASFQTTDTAEAGQFGIFAEAELRYFVFSEKDLRALVVADLQKSVEGGQALNIELKELTANYEKAKLDLANGAADFSYKGKAVFRPIFSTASFIDQIAGLSENQLREKMLAIPGLEKGKIALWPFWVKSAPGNADRIELNLE